MLQGCKAEVTWTQQERLTTRLRVVKSNQTMDGQGGLEPQGCKGKVGQWGREPQGSRKRLQLEGC